MYPQKRTFEEGQPSEVHKRANEAFNSLSSEFTAKELFVFEEAFRLHLIEHCKALIDNNDNFISIRANENELFSQIINDLRR